MQCFCSSLRSLSTTQAQRASRDSSSIDFAYMPQHELRAPPQGDIIRVPILPHNTTAARPAQEVIESVITPEIATVSASGTHIESPSAMSDVTDNHALELSPYDLTGKVANAAAAAASNITGMSTERLKEPGVVQELWSGILDDILGGKKMAKA